MENYKNLSKSQLSKALKDSGIKGTSKMSKKEMLEMIEGNQEVLEGAGFFDFLNKAGRFVSRGVSQAVALPAKGLQRIFSPSKDLSNTSKKTLLEYGKYPIVKLQIYRTPLSKTLDTLLSAVSFGKIDELKKKYGYDKFYHLALVATVKLPRGEKNIIIEKNEAPNISTKYETSELTEMDTLPPITRNITLEELIYNTWKAVGDRFLKYDAFSTNCQLFIIDILRTNGLLDKEAEDFILQPMDELAKELPAYVKGTAKFITDLGGTVANITGKGEGGNKAAGYIRMRMAVEKRERQKTQPKSTKEGDIFYVATKRNEYKFNKYKSKKFDPEKMTLFSEYIYRLYKEQMPKIIKELVEKGYYVYYPPYSGYQLHDEDYTTPKLRKLKFEKSPKLVKLEEELRKKNPELDMRNFLVGGVASGATLNNIDNVSSIDNVFNKSYKQIMSMIEGEEIEEDSPTEDTEEEEEEEEEEEPKKETKKRGRPKGQQTMEEKSPEVKQLMREIAGEYNVVKLTVPPYNAQENLVKYLRSNYLTKLSEEDSIKFLQRVLLSLESNQFQKLGMKKRYKFLEGLRPKKGKGLSGGNISENRQRIKMIEEEIEKLKKDSYQNSQKLRRGEIKTLNFNATKKKIDERRASLEEEKRQLQGQLISQEESSNVLPDPSTSLDLNLLATPEQIQRGEYYDYKNQKYYKPLTQKDIQEYKQYQNVVSSNILAKQEKQYYDQFGGIKGFKDRYRGAILGPMIATLNKAEAEEDIELYGATIKDFIDYLTRFGYFGKYTPATGQQEIDYRVAINAINNEDMRNQLLEVLDDLVDNQFIGSFWSERIEQAEALRQAEFNRAMEEWRRKNPFLAILNGVAIGLKSFVEESFLEPISNLAGNILSILPLPPALNFLKEGAQNIQEFYRKEAERNRRLGLVSNQNVLGATKGLASTFNPLSGVSEGLQTASLVSDVGRLMLGRGRKYDPIDMARNKIKDLPF